MKKRRIWVSEEFAKELRKGAIQNNLTLPTYTKKITNMLKDDILNHNKEMPKKKRGFSL